MSNHSSDFGDTPIPEAIRQILGKPLIGATGTHPQGKLTQADEGAIQFAIGVKDGKVCIDFGTPVKWLGMEPGQALELASSLIQHAKNAAKGTGSILTLNI
jgi:hypothetical protein